MNSANHDNRHHPHADRRDAHISHLDDLPIHESIPGETLWVRVSQRQANGAFAILETIAAPGTATPLHTHLEDEVFYVLEGEPSFQLGSEIVHGQPGSVAFIPRGTPHAWRNGTGQDVRMLAFFVPGLVGDLFPRFAGLNPEQIVELAATYGTAVVGPPMTA